MAEIAPQPGTNWQPFAVGIVAAVLLLALLVVCGAFGGCAFLLALLLLLDCVT